MNSRSEAHTRILAHLAEVNRANEMAETSSVELERELGLDRETVFDCLDDLVAQGLAWGDLFPLIKWVRITPEGAAALTHRPNGSGD